MLPSRHMRRKRTPYVSCYVSCAFGRGLLPATFLRSLTPTDTHTRTHTHTHTHVDVHAELPRAVPDARSAPPVRSVKRPAELALERELEEVKRSNEVLRLTVATQRAELAALHSMVEHCQASVSALAQRDALTAYYTYVAEYHRLQGHMQRL